MAPHIRTVKTASGARAVQIVYSNRGGRRTMVHVGSAHDDAELELLRAAARQRISAGQGELELPGLAESAAGGPLPIRSSRMGHLVDALCQAYRVLGLQEATGGDEVFQQLVLARIIEPNSKLDSARVLTEAGVAAASYATLKRRLPVYATEDFRAKLASACAARAVLGRTALVLYDVSTLYFETDTVRLSGGLRVGRQRLRTIQRRARVLHVGDHSGGVTFRDQVDRDSALRRECSWMSAHAAWRFSRRVLRLASPRSISCRVEA